MDQRGPSIPTPSATNNAAKSSYPYAGTCDTHPCSLPRPNLPPWQCSSIRAGHTACQDRAPSSASALPQDYSPILHPRVDILPSPPPERNRHRAGRPRIFRAAAAPPRRRADLAGRHGESSRCPPRHIAGAGAGGGDRRRLRCRRSPAAAPNAAAATLGRLSSGRRRRRRRQTAAASGSGSVKG
jgi:hypothetical protein